jgi:predicted transcriptional regulator of viral defense system
MRRSLVIDPGLDKLQELLLEMVPGDEVSVARAAEVSGLDDAQCDAVLEALMRAGLMIRLQPGDYVRCQLDGLTSRVTDRRPVGEKPLT